MRKFKSVRQAQRFLGAHAVVSNLFNLGRHLISAEHHRNLRAAHHARDIELIFEPLDFIAKLAALVPKPRTNLTRFARIIPDTRPLRGPAKAVQIHSG